MRLFVEKSNCEGTSICTLSVITSNWNSKECSWINASDGTPWKTMGGDFSHNYVMLSAAAKAGGIENYDVTTNVNAIIRGDETNYGYLLEPASDKTDDYPMKGHIYSSSEQADVRLRPALILEY